MSSHHCVSCTLIWKGWSADNACFYSLNPRALGQETRRILRQKVVSAMHAHQHPSSTWAMPSNVKRRRRRRNNPKDTHGGQASSTAPLPLVGQRQFSYPPSVTEYTAKDQKTGQLTKTGPGRQYGVAQHHPVSARFAQYSSREKSTRHV